MIEKRKPGRPPKTTVEIPIRVEVTGQGTVGEPAIGPESLKNAPQGEKSKHPYGYEVVSHKMVPAAFCDDDGNVLEDAIDKHLQRCYDISTVPNINGVLVFEAT